MSTRSITRRRSAGDRGDGSAAGAGDARRVERANALNLLAVRALVNGAPGLEAEHDVAPAGPVPDAGILPMADLGGLDEPRTTGSSR